MCAKQRFSFASPVLTLCLMGVFVAGCSSSTTGNGGKSSSSGASLSVENAKAELIATADTMGGPDVTFVRNVISVVEKPGAIKNAGWGAVDRLIQSATPETRAAYDRYRAAVIAASK